MIWDRQAEHEAAHQRSMRSERWFIRSALIAPVVVLVAISLVQDVPSWQPVQAEVTQATLWSGVDQKGSLSDRKRTVKHAPDVTYEYWVNGRRYTSSNIGRVLKTTDRKRAEADLAQWPVGRQIDVFYDPDDPRVATTDPAAREIVSAFGLIVGSAISFLLLAIFELSHLRAKIANRRAEAEGQAREAALRERRAERRARLGRP